MQAYLQSPLSTYSQYQAPSRSEPPDSTERTSLSVINLHDALIRHHGEPHGASDPLHPLERREVEGLCPSPPPPLYFLSLQHAPLGRQTPQIQQAHTAPQPETQPRRPISSAERLHGESAPGTRQASRRVPSGLEEIRRRVKYSTGCLKFGVYKSSCRMRFIFV